MSELKWIVGHAVVVWRLGGLIGVGKTPHAFGVRTVLAVVKEKVSFQGVFPKELLPPNCPLGYVTISVYLEEFTKKQFSFIHSLKTSPVMSSRAFPFHCHNVPFNE